MSIKEKIIDGKYNYFNNGNVYSEEVFNVQREGGLQGNLIFNSEVMSRVHTGEFLKIIVEYEVTKSFEPINVRIVRQLGAKQSTEEYSINDKTKNYVYSFDNGGMRPFYFEKVMSHTNHIIAPSFVTTMLMINSKKVDPVQRTPYQLVSSENIWDFKGGFTEKEVYLELMELEPQNIHIDGNDLKATHCKMMQVDKKGTIIDDDQHIWLSKHFSIPYLAKFGNEFEVRIETLKNYESRAGKIY